jgi:hypothetical protein
MALLQSMDFVDRVKVHALLADLTLLDALLAGRMKTTPKSTCLVGCALMNVLLGPQLMKSVRFALVVSLVAIVVS